MKRVLIVVVLIVAAAVLGLWRSHGGIRRNLGETIGMAKNDPDGEARDEIRKSFDLQPGARLEIRGINGAVQIETSDTKSAEVYVLRTANSREALNRREVTIEQTSSGLSVRGRESHNLGFWEHLFGRNPSEQVTIKAPRQIALSLAGINGRVTSGNVDGSLELRGINGKVELGQATTSIQVSGVNGNISIGVKQLADGGARFSGVNGNIELRLANDLNADLSTRGMNGNVRSEIPEVNVEKEEHGSRYSARIGNGGPTITVSGLNGNVRLTPLQEPATAQPVSADAAEKKSMAQGQWTESKTGSSRKTQ
jgi:DUF4097 and DUF4098 domain-containing protein YvlB